MVHMVKQNIFLIIPKDHQNNESDAKKIEIEVCNQFTKTDLHKSSSNKTPPTHDSFSTFGFSNYPENLKNQTAIFPVSLKIDGDDGLSFVKNGVFTKTVRFTHVYIPPQIHRCRILKKVLNNSSDPIQSYK